VSPNSVSEISAGNVAGFLAIPTEDFYEGHLINVETGDACFRHNISVINGDGLSFLKILDSD
jgi:hypothetical protein